MNLRKRKRKSKGLKVGDSVIIIDERPLTYGKIGTIIETGPLAGPSVYKYYDYKLDFNNGFVGWYMRKQLRRVKSA